MRPAAPFGAQTTVALVACVLATGLSGRQQELDFDPPTAERHEASGVPVYLLEERSLPLVTVHARIQGGYARFGRANYAAGTALPAMLRYGGTLGMSPDSVDRVIHHYALQTAFGGGGESVSATVNTLTEFLPEAMDLWWRLLAEPAFDPDELEVWRDRQLERIRHRNDDAGALAFSEFNRLMYGDHPIGWEMRSSDLTPERLSRSRIAELHSRLFCRERVTLGVTGDTSWEEFRPLAERLFDRMASCSDSLPESPVPHVGREPGIFLLHREIPQSVIVMAQPSEVRLADDQAYYSATIANSILGSGGFSSRLMAKVRGERGYAYSVSSLWTMPRRHAGLLGATTRTGPENAAAAVVLILETMTGLGEAPPDREEVRTAVDALVNGFVFSFENPGQIVARTMYYATQDLPQDWLSRYVRGIRRVTPESVHKAFQDNLEPSAMTMLVVGDTTRMDMAALARIAPVRKLRSPSAGSLGLAPVERGDPEAEQLVPDLLEADASELVGEGLGAGEGADGARQVRVRPWMTRNEPAQ